MLMKHPILMIYGVLLTMSPENLPVALVVLVAPSECAGYTIVGFHQTSAQYWWNGRFPIGIPTTRGLLLWVLLSLY